MWSIGPRAYVVDLALVDRASLAWVACVTLVSVAILSLPFAVSTARRHFTEALCVGMAPVDVRPQPLDFATIRGAPHSHRDTHILG